MGAQYYAEVRIFANQYPPRDWAYCDGQLMAINQNAALFSLLGAVFGGDSRTTFGLPDIKERTVAGQGRNPYSGQTRYFGQAFGYPSVQLSTNQLPTHTHDAYAIIEPSKEEAPDSEAFFAGAINSALGSYSKAYAPLSTTGAPTTPLDPYAMAHSGGGDSHNNYQPFLALRYCIAFDGIYPPRA